MPRNKYEIRDIKVRKLGKIGSAKNYSYYVTLPMDFVKELGWKDGQKLAIRKPGKKQRLIVEDVD